MSATNPAIAPKDFSDLFNDLVNRIREQSGVTATDNQAKRYINLALLDMHIGTQYKFPWAERRNVLRTKAQYTTGTIAVTRGSTTVTGTGTDWDTNNDFSEKNLIAGGKVTINGTDEVYTVASVTSDTAFELDTPYIGTTVASGGGYLYFEDEYGLVGDFLRFVDTRSFNESRTIIIVSRTDFRRAYPANDVTGRPDVATIMDKPFSGSAAPVRHVRLHRPPDQEYLIPYDYITNQLAVSAAGAAQVSMVADTDEPIVPYRYRNALTSYALYIWYRDKKDDMQRSTSAHGDYVDIMLRTTADQEVGAPRPRIDPGRSAYARAARRPFNRTARRFSSVSRFDELRDRR